MNKIFIAILCCLPGMAWAQLTTQQIDSLTEQVLSAFDVPGIAIGVIENGNVVHAKGYGVRSLNNKLPVNEHTLFGIASNSKAFTCVALCMLIDEGKLSWEDKVTRHIPEFALADTYATQHFTIKDLVTHRSGLGLGAGDLMFFPEGGNRTVAEIISGMRYQKPVSSFRSEYKYNNNFYIIAGEIIKRVSGKSWEEFIEQRILEPVGMVESKASYNRLTKRDNLIDAHAPVDGQAIVVTHDWSEVANPAGGIMSNISDLSKWAKVVMNNFELPNGRPLISKARLQELWNVHNPFPVALGGPYNTHFNGYGMGWVLTDIKGNFQVSHTGGLLGTVTQFIVFPDIDLAIIVLTNQQQGLAFATISNTIKDSYLGYPNRNWLDNYRNRYIQFNKQVANIKDSIQLLVRKEKWNVTRERSLTGKYTDDWMGDVRIFKVGKVLRLEVDRSPRLKGNILPISDTTFLVKWDDRSYDADVYMVAEIDPTTGQAAALTMEAYSPSTDFSFDFHNLHLKRTHP